MSTSWRHNAVGLEDEEQTEARELSGANLLTEQEGCQIYLPSKADIDAVEIEFAFLISIGYI